MNTLVKKVINTLLPCMLLFPSAGLKAGTVSEAPLFLTSNIQPNIFFLVDDSGSMNWEILKSDGARSAYTYSEETILDITPTRDDNDEMLESCAGYNVLYYDPNLTYTPWVGTDSNGDAYGDQSITAARDNPYDPSSTTDLTDDEGFGDPPGYFVWSDDGDGVFEAGECPDPALAGFDYDNQFIATASGYSVNNVMTAAQQANFANWYTYYRKREYVMKSALLSIINSSNARLGLGTLHRNGGNGFPVADMTSGTNRVDLMDETAEIDSSSGTPLRSKLVQVGDYFEGTTSTSLFGSIQSSPILSAANGGSCQQNFAVVMSDGFWNGSAPSVGNADSGDTTDNDSNDTAFDGGSYADQNTGVSNTLADVAMHYYERDLNTGLDNEVPTSPADSNTQQHLVTYTVAFGVNGTLTADPSTSDTSFNWPTPVEAEDTTIDDMRHAAWNGLGEFLSADSPTALITAFNNAVASIASRTSSASAVATNSTRLDTTSNIYQARFVSENWYGQLLAYDIDDVTGDVGSIVWDASDFIPAEDDRNIFSYNDTTNLGVIFEHANLDATQQGYLTSDELDYIRGDQSNEGTPFRPRVKVLGDIVNSDPIFTADENFDYYQLELDINDEATYDTYLYGTASPWQKGNRKSVLYVGGNDGMLHAFLAEGTTGCSDASDGDCEGEEIFAYVPKAIMSKLKNLTEAGYTHEYFVDGTPKHGDAYIDFDGTGDRWGTALASGLGAGGKGLFALDISDPMSFSASDVLWDLDESDLADLGLTFAQPSIVKLRERNTPTHSGWGVIVGNGYYSANHEPVLYILDLEDGSLIKEFKVGAGYRGSASATNGLSTPIAIDTNNDSIADTVYAGDLQGNMWKFDISAKNENNWEIAFNDNSNGDGTGNAVPFFTACTDDPCTDPQPITSRPQVISSSQGVPELMVLFGTGKYFEEGDNTDTSQVQTFYGVLDDGDTVSGRNVLLEQLILAELDAATTGLNYDTRVTTDIEVNYNTQEGWYLDFDSADYPGERIVSNSLVRSGRIIFTTLVPETDPCAFGGTSWLMEMDAQSGSRLPTSPFDLDDDGAFTDSDLVRYDSDGDGDIDDDDEYVAASGKKSTVGIIKTPGIISTGDKELKYTSGSSGDIEVTTESSGDVLGRQSWIQIR